MSAIILDGHLKSALTMTRSLGRRNIPVSVGSVRPTGMSLHSKYATRTFVYSSPSENETEFLESLEREAKRLGDMPVVYTASDATFLVVYRARERLSKVVTLVYPDAHAIEVAFDKAATQSLARVLNVPTIPTYIPATSEELVRVSKNLQYPAVIKPRRSLTYVNGVYHFGSAVFVHTQEELISTYKRLEETLHESPLIQERISGEEYGVEMIAHRGEISARIVHHRLRSLSPTGGASVLKETLEAGPLRDLLDTHARTIVRDLRWEGPVMVEFKVDADTKMPVLMEVNGRFWGSLPLSVAAGVDMPYIFYHLAKDGVFPPEEYIQKDGVITRHFWGDVRHLFNVLWSKDGMRIYTYPDILSALRMFLFPPKGTRGDVWSIEDPKPAFMEPVDLITRVWK